MVLTKSLSLARVPLLVSICLVALAAAQPVWAQAGRGGTPAAESDEESNGLTHHTFGVGIYGQTAGVPPGATFKYWFRDSYAGVVDFGYSSGDAHLRIFRMSYLSHDIAPLLKNIIPLYAGLGLSIVEAGSESSVDELEGAVLRVPLGVNFLLRRYPLELFVEAAPGVRLASSTRVLIDSSIGIRFYFW